MAANEDYGQEIHTPHTSTELDQQTSISGSDALVLPSEPMPRLLGCPVNQAADLKQKEASSEWSVMEEVCANAEQVERARHVSLFSFVASLGVATLAVTLGITESTLSLVGLGGEMLLDGISSAFVLWRFKRPKQHPPVSRAELSKSLERDARRERNSSIGIGLTFILLALFLTTSATSKLLLWDAGDPEHQRKEQKAAIYGSILVWTSVVVFGGLAIVKYQLAEALQSQVLRKDAVCSVLGALLGVIVGVTDLVALANRDDPQSLALVDPIAGGIIAALLGVEGCRTLWHNRQGGGHAEDHQRFP
jgi:hypothetical protein